MNKVKTVMFFSNGNTAVFDAEGNQIPSLQNSWLLLFMKFLQSNSTEPIDFDKTEIVLPDIHCARVFKLENGEMNWEVL